MSFCTSSSPLLITLTCRGSPRPATPDISQIWSFFSSTGTTGAPPTSSPRTLTTSSSSSRGASSTAFSSKLRRFLRFSAILLCFRGMPLAADFRLSLALY
uniref:(northern house mosquito) hypothetical protein n=1 Tax=Culex pipiens TaxID=7175 RepID=A0A8D8AGM6_CULPI